MTAITVALPKPAALLFALLPDVGQPLDELQAFGQRIARSFPHAAVVCLPAETSATALWQQLQQWQAQMGVNHERTCVVALGQSGTAALDVAVAHEAAIARLYVVGSRFSALPDSMHLNTCVHMLHGKADPVMPFQAATEAGAHLRTLDADFTVDVYPMTGREFTDEMQERILHLLQNHVPKRLWKEAMAQSAQQHAGNDTLQ